MGDYYTLIKMSQYDTVIISKKKRFKTNKSLILQSNIQTRQLEFMTCFQLAHSALKI